MAATTIIEIPCGQGGNAARSYLVIGDRPILVDAGLPGAAESILSTLRRYAVLPTDISLILITHGHLDHTGGAAALKARSRAPIAIHRADAEYLRTGTSAPVRGRNLVGKLLSRAVVHADESAAGDQVAVEPDVVIDGGMSLERWGIRGDVVCTPGHTDGSISLLLEDGRAIVGDLLASAPLRRDVPTPGIFAVDEQAMRQSIRELVAHRPLRTYASHSAPFSLAQIQRAFG